MEVHRELDVDVVLLSHEELQVVEDLRGHVGEEVRVLAELDQLHESEHTTNWFRSNRLSRSLAVCISSINLEPISF